MEVGNKVYIIYICLLFSHQKGVDRKNNRGPFLQKERTIAAVKPYRLCLNFTILLISGIHHTFSSCFFLSKKNKVCKKGSVLTAVAWKLSVIIFS